MELRDGDKKRYLGKGVLKAVENVDNILGPVVIGLDAFDQAGLHHAMMEKPTALPTSVEGRRQRHPRRLDGGGARGGRGAGRAALQVPRWPGRARPARPLDEHHQRRRPRRQLARLPGVHDRPQGAAALLRGAARWAGGVPHAEERSGNDKKASTGVGDEGGFAPDLPGAEAACATIIEAIEKAGYKPGKDVALALDVASSELWDKSSKTYKLEGEKKELDGKGMVEFYKKLSEQFPIVSIEDGLGEDDWDGWVALTQALGKRVQLVGDDLFVTNTERIKM